jgi:hypothetical protein
MGVGNANKGGDKLANWPNGTMEKWDGTKWSLWPGSSAGSLSGVSCVASTSFCVAVGKKSWGGSLAEYWNGSGWVFQSTPDPSGGTVINLEDVSCTSETACTAVGHYYASGTKTLAERWNGTSWSIQTTPNPSGEEGSAGELTSVSCTSSTSCMAVGHKSKSGTRAFAERWNGTEWTIVSVPSPSEEARFEDVSCTSSTSCMAVGWQGPNGSHKALAEGWNGTEWTVVSTPTPSEAKTIVELHGVSCTSSSSCVAVGEYATKTFSGVPEATKTLVESWNGSEWTIKSSPNPEGAELPSLAAVSCSSSVACTAVGGAQTAFSKTGIATLAERWE